MGSSKSSKSPKPAETQPVITPAVAKDAAVAEPMQADAIQQRSLRRGIASTYTRYRAMQGSDEPGAKKQTLG